MILEPLHLINESQRAGLCLGSRRLSVASPSAVDHFAHPATPPPRNSSVAFLFAQEIPGLDIFNKSALLGLSGSGSVVMVVLLVKS